MEMCFRYPVVLRAISDYVAITTVNTVSIFHTINMLIAIPNSICTSYCSLNACLLFFLLLCIVVYYDVANRKARQDKSKPADIEVVMNFTNSFATARFWEVRVSQIPFSQRAPAGCLQYFFGNAGTIQVNCEQFLYFFAPRFYFHFLLLFQTFNFAENGRHLSNQRYKSCVRQEKGMCSISYEPCNQNSFRIGPTRQLSPYQNQLIPTYPNFPGAPFAYQANPYQANPYFPNPPPLGNPILTPNGVVIPNPYAAPNAILPPNRIVYDANGNPSIIDPSGLLIPVNPNGLPGKVALLSLSITANQ